jgi:hypothetical protein
MIVLPVGNARFQPFGCALSLALLLAAQVWFLPVKEAPRIAVMAGLVIGVVLASVGSFLRSRTIAPATRRIGLVLLLASIAILVVAIGVDISAARSINVSGSG